VSGGEAVLLGLAAQFLRRPDVLLLDEPTNNLDLDTRRRLYDAVVAWPRVMVLVSHDRALLELADRVAELRDGKLRWYGGNLTAYERAVAAEQGAAQRLVRTAAADVQRQQRELREARIKLDRRRRYGQKMWDTKREPKIIMGARKRQAEVAAGKHRGMHLDKLEESRRRLAEATEAVRDDDEIRVDLPGTAVPAGRTVLTVHDARLRGGARVELEIRGPERIALLGANGAGKTTLLETIVGTLDPLAGSVAAAVPVRYLPQRLDLLDDRATVAANVARFALGASDNAVRARLARFLFRGQRADQPVSTLSAASASAPPWPPCCWPSRHPSCCCSTSRPTTSTWPAPASSPRPSPPTRAPCSWPATTWRSYAPSGSPAGCAWPAGSSRSTRRDLAAHLTAMRR
jgi:ATPase subunit of ABC transporter with duplicated ATPase domains